MTKERISFLLFVNQSHEEDWKLIKTFMCFKQKLNELMGKLMNYNRLGYAPPTP
jgi:hypothetical protein